MRIIVQCRLSSTRLPAKALLPVGGFPSAVLCARRAANTGHEVVVAVSDDPSDDALVDTLHAYRLEVVRGPLHDVRARFLMAAEDLPDDETVVRLTADNVFPDGAFTSELVSALRGLGGDYLATHSPYDGLPYGLSAEAFRLGALRRAAAEGGSEADREHVTPALRRPSVPPPFRPVSATADRSHLRCTLDSFGDYLTLQRVFRGVDEPVAISWTELCARLAGLPGASKFRIPFRGKSGRPLGVLAVGTAQLGLERYGAANASGRPLPKDAAAMIHAAIGHGVTVLDCARAYGDAERVVGEALEHVPRDQVAVVTKLDPMSNVTPDAGASAVEASVEASVMRSCREIRTRKLDVLMVHRWAHRTSHGGAVWRTLQRLRAEGCISALGASVYTPAEALEVLADDGIHHLQIPFNILDGRWASAGVPEAVARRPDMTVYARSVFLQGVLAAGPETWPRVDGVDGRSWVRRLDAVAERLGRKDRADLCVAYVRSRPWIDALVLGMETMGQLEANLELVRLPPLSQTEAVEAECALAGASEVLLNPGRWR